MKARLYFAAVLFFSCARVYESLTQISLYEGIEVHTDPTDLTEFARLMLNLTDAPRFLLKAYLIRFLHLFYPFKPDLHRIK